jgi:carbamoyltransferase
MPDYRLGISAFFHDSAAALVRDGVVVAAAQEERFSRRRHDRSFPASAIRFCLSEARIGLGELASVTFYEDPAIKFRRVLASFASAGPAAFSAFADTTSEWLRWKRRTLRRVDQELAQLGLGEAPKASAIQHHRAHAASAFFPSPFEDAAVLCIDGVGEWHTTTIWRGHRERLELVNSISFPHSLGLLYSAFTAFCGFKVDSGEYKLMGLAPYGEPRYADLILSEIVSLRPNGSFSLNLAHFEFLRGERMVGDGFARLFGGPPRAPEGPLTQRECDLAASVQAVTDEAVLGLARAARDMTGSRNLCMAGGVALNCVSNANIAKSGLFKSLWIQPAAGDAGGALGAALDSAVGANGRRLSAEGGSDGMFGALLGPEFTDDEIEAYLLQQGYSHKRLDEDTFYESVAEALDGGAVVGWFQGRMEFGPRALGARSIIADPRNSEMQRVMNLKIKFRESFRPFAPSVLEADATRYFDLEGPSPYMLVVAPVVEKHRLPASPGRSLGSINEARSTLPAVTHVDFSARVQTVSIDRTPRFARLISRFKQLTGCGVLVNTSFNVRGEPIVCTPEEAYRCFMRTDIDLLVLGACLLRKTEQSKVAEDTNWRAEIALD